MFGFRKKKKKENVYVHPKFGEMIHVHGMWSPVVRERLQLWDKDYDVPLTFLVENKEAAITSVQEEAYEKYKSIVAERREEMERLAYPEGDNELALSDRIIPQEIYFSRKGECAIFFKDMEAEMGNSIYYSTFCSEFAITVLPIMLRAPYRICIECMFGRAEFASIKELAGTGK